MQHERDLSLVGDFFRRIGIPLPQVSGVTSSRSQRVSPQETEVPPTMEDITRELDRIKLGFSKDLDDPRTGFSYFGLYVSARKLDGISAETRSALGLNGGNGGVRILYVYDNMGIARKISLLRGPKRASFIVDNGPSRFVSPLQARGREETEMTLADAFLVAKLGSERVRV